MTPAAIDHIVHCGKLLTFTYATTVENTAKLSYNHLTNTSIKELGLPPESMQEHKMK